jgi:50S ribosomal subunit-associated GTPase HflX
MHSKKQKNRTGFREPQRILLLNKADRLRDNAALLVWQQRFPEAIPFCALPAKEGDPSPLGQEDLLERIRAAIVGEVREVKLTISMREGRIIDLVEKQAEVLDRKWDDGTVTLTALIGTRLLEQISSNNAVRVL